MEDVDILAESIIKIEEVKEEPMDKKEDYCCNSIAKDESGTLQHSVKEENDKDEELESPVTIFIQPMEKQGALFEETKDPLVACCERTSSRKIEPEIASSLVDVTHFEMEKRNRSANFTKVEREILLEIVKANRNILENKRTSDISSQEKKKCWRKVEEEFNMSSIVTKRSAKCLQKCWENLKKAARRLVAAEKEDIFRTGGRVPKSVVRDNVLEGVLSLIGPSSCGIPNNHDCDAPESPVRKENVSEDILEIEIPADQIPATVSEASDGPSGENLFVMQEVLTSSPCSAQLQVEVHPSTLNMLHPPPSTSIPMPSCSNIPIPSSNISEFVTTSQSKSSPPLQSRNHVAAWRRRRRPAPPPQSAEEGSRALLQARLELIELNKKLALQEHEWKKELHKEQLREQKLKNRLLLLEIKCKNENSE